MLQGLNRKTVIAVDTSTVTTGGTLTAQIDTLGFEEVSIDVKLGSIANATAVPTVLTVAESDVTNSTTFVNIVPLVGGTATSSTVGFVIPQSGATAAPAQIVKFDISCVKGFRKRYLLVTITTAEQQVCDVRASLGRSAQLPNTAAEMGVTTYVAV